MAARQAAAARREKEKAAKKACATGDYQEGVDILADLYVDTNEIVYVYNQGRCYQQSSRWEQAISRFREYLRKAKNLTVSESEETQRQIDECQLALDRATAVTPPPMETPPPSPGFQAEVTAAQPQPATDEVQGAAALAESPAKERSHKRLRVAGIIVAAVGGAAIGTGIVLALKANSLSTDGYSRSRESERSTLRTWGSICYGVGATAIVTGAILYIVGWPRQSSSSVAFVPVVASNGAALLLQGSY